MAKFRSKYPNTGDDSRVEINPDGNKITVQNGQERHSVRYDPITDKLNIFYWDGENSHTVSVSKKTFNRIKQSCDILEKLSILELKIGTVTTLRVGQEIPAGWSKLDLPIVNNLLQIQYDGQN